MKKITALIFVSCFALILAACNETVPAPPQEPEPAVTEAPVSTPAPPQTPATESSPASEADAAQTETPPETLPVPRTVSETAPEPDADTDTIIISEEPSLPDTLSRNCRITQESDDFDETGIAVGETAINFNLKDINGSEFQLSRLLAEKPVMMVFGSFT
jgi:cytoskeletal protein RodZ